MFFKLLNHQRSTKSSRQNRKGQRRKLLLESLETRNLMAADGFASVSEGTWTFDPTSPETADFGQTGDVFVAGDWFGNGQDHRTVVRPNSAGDLRWTTSDGVVSINVTFGKEGDIPVVGDWNGDGVDNLGVVRKGPHGFMEWHFDLDLDRDAEFVLHYGLNTDIPVVGNWDDDPGDEMGVVRDWGDGLLTWMIDTDGDPTEEITYKYGLPGDIPVVGDWDDDGRSNLGVVRDNGTGGHRWYLGTNFDATEDITFDFGKVGDIPVAGDFEFPTLSAGYTFTQHNGSWPVKVTSNSSYERQQRHQLGWIEDGRMTLTKEIEIRNDSEIPLHLSKARIAQGNIPNETYKQFKILESPEWVAPGETGKLVVFVDGTESPLPRNYSEAFIEFDTNDISASPFIFHVYTTKAAVVVPAPEIVVRDGSRGLIDGQSTVEFTSVEQGTPVSSKTITIKNSGRANLVVETITSSSDQFSIIGDTSFTLPPNQSRSVDIHLLTGVFGKHESNIEIINNDNNERVFNFRMKGEVVPKGNTPEPPSQEPDIHFPDVPTNKRIDFGSIDKNSQSPTRTISIENRGNRTLTASFHVSGSRFAIQGRSSVSIPAGEKYELPISMKTTSIGTHHASLTIRSNDPNDRLVKLDLSGRVVAAPVPKAPPEIHVRIRRTPLSPLIDLPPNTTGSVNFGGVAKAGAASHYRTIAFTVENRGDEPLVLSDLSTPAGYQIPRLNEPLTIQGHSQTQLKLQMNIVQLGRKSGVVSFETNDPDEPIVRIQVNGRVFPAVVKVHTSDAARGDNQGNFYVTSSGLVQIQPLNGTVAWNAEYVVEADNSRHSLARTVRTVHVCSPIPPENWTGLTVVHTTTGCTKTAENLAINTRHDLAEQATPNADTIESSNASRTSVANPLDVNRDGTVSPLDVLNVVNTLNAVETGTATQPHMDVNLDGIVTPIDVLMIVNHLNRQQNFVAEGEMSMVENTLGIYVQSADRTTNVNRSIDSTRANCSVLPPQITSRNSIDRAEQQESTVRQRFPNREAFAAAVAEFDSLDDVVSELLTTLHN